MDSYNCLGAVMLWGSATPPEGWAFCDGQSLNARDSMDNSALVTVLTNKFGGDGTRTFNLPKLDNVGSLRYIICVGGEDAIMPYYYPL